MTEHTVKSFTEELEQLASELLRMGGLAESMVLDATDAIVRGQAPRLKDVIQRDMQIDLLQEEVERSIVRLLALRQPLAHDLRSVISALKVSNDLERVGDLAKNIARRGLAIGDLSSLPARQSIDRMSLAVGRQLKRVLDAYTTASAEDAEEVWRLDEEIDEHYNSIFREVLTYMMEDPRTIGVGAHLLFIAKNLERIGDHCTNISELIYFSVTGTALPIDRPKSSEFEPSS